MWSCNVFQFSFQCFYMKKNISKQETLCDALSLQEKPDVCQPFTDGDKHGFRLCTPCEMRAFQME